MFEAASARPLIIIAGFKLSSVCDAPKMTFPIHVLGRGRMRGRISCSGVICKLGHDGATDSLGMLLLEIDVYVSRNPQMP